MISSRLAGKAGDRTRARGPRPRAGVAMVELVVVLPLLAFILVAATDFARAFHDLVTITESARNASLFAAQNAGMTAASYQSGISAAALADAGGLGITLTGSSPTFSTPTVATASGSLGTQNNYVDVTVTNQFTTLSAYPGIPASITLSRTIRTRVQPTVYRMQ